MRISMKKGGLTIAIVLMVTAAASLVQCVSDETGSTVVIADGGPGSSDSPGSGGQTDGTIAATDSATGDGSTANEAAAPACVFVDAGDHGALDPTYNNSTLALPNGGAASAAAIDKLGRVYLAYPRTNCFVDGTHTQSMTDISVARLDDTGHLDTTFGTGGYACIGYSNGSPNDPNDRNYEDIPYAIAIDDQGRVVVAGESNHYPSLVRFTSAGQPDTSFGPTGNGFNYYLPAIQEATEAGVTVRQLEVVIPIGQNIFVAGSAVAGTSGRFGLVALVQGTDGSIVPSFQPKGAAIFRADLDVTGYHGASVDGSRLLVAGSRADGAWIVRALKLDGQIDPTFGTSGDAVMIDAGADAGTGNLASLVASSSGISVYGGSSLYEGATLFSLSPTSGAQQAVFTNTAFQSIGPNYASAARGCDGRIVTTATLGQFVATGDSYPFLLGYNAAGNAFDPAFGEGGTATWVVPNGGGGFPAALALSVLVDPRNGKYVLIGTTDTPATLLARFNP